DVSAYPATDQPADDAADQCARNHKTQQRIGGIGLGGVGQIRKSRIDEVGFQAVHGAVDDSGVISEQQSAQSGNERKQNDPRVYSQHKRLCQSTRLMLKLLIVVEGL